MGSADSFQKLLLLPDANQWDSQLTSQHLLLASRTSADNSTSTLVHINITNFLLGNGTFTLSHDEYLFNDFLEINATWSEIDKNDSQ